LVTVMGVHPLLQDTVSHPGAAEATARQRPLMVRGFTRRQSRLRLCETAALCYGLHRSDSMIGSRVRSAMWRVLCAAIMFAGILALLMLSPSAASAQKRVALVVGNSAYIHTGVLANPRNDAIDVAEALSRHGFNVIDGFDLDRRAFEQKIREFAGSLVGADVAIFFYAGHGLQVGGHNYIVPVDARLLAASDLDWEMIKLDVVHRTMERETKTNIVFLDACRDNPLARNLARAMGARSADIGRGLAAVESGVGTLISFSTQPGNVALDGTGRNSPFAGALVQQLQLGGNNLSDMLINVRKEVMAATGNRQVPWEHSALTARFYFSEVTATAEQEKEMALWKAVEETNSPAAIREYLNNYPQGAYAVLARDLLRALENQKKQQARESKRDADLLQAQEDVRKAKEAVKAAEEARKAAEDGRKAARPRTATRYPSNSCSSTADRAPTSLVRGEKVCSVDEEKCPGGYMQYEYTGEPFLAGSCVAR
jgi:uncharacterized caspase-like protein